MPDSQSPRSRRRRAKEKERFFEALYALDHVEDDEAEDIGLSESKAFFTQAANGKCTLVQPVSTGNKQPIPTSEGPQAPQVSPSTILRSVPLDKSQNSPAALAALQPVTASILPLPSASSDSSSFLSSEAVNLLHRPLTCTEKASPPNLPDPTSPFSLRRSVRRSGSISPSLRRSISAPEQNQLKILSSHKSPLHHSPNLVRSASTTSMPPRSTMLTGDLPRALGKRKRDADITLVPENRRIFKDLVFYFFPNSDSHPARRMRIIKALEYGAIWAKDWNDQVTHIVVDNDNNYEQLTSWLKLNTLPEKILCVNETYPSECISFMMLRDPSQNSFRVKGAPIEKPSSASERTTGQGNTSLSSDRTSLSLQTTSRDERAASDPGLSDDKKLQTQYRDENDKARDSVFSDATSRQAGLELIPKLHSKVLSFTHVSQEEYGIDEAIDDAKIFEDLPLDSDEEEETSPSFTANQEDLTNDELDRQSVSRSRKNKSSDQTFQCMHKHDGTAKAQNPNRRTIEILEQMGRYYDQTNDHWRTIAYRKAVSSLRKHDRKVTTKDEALQLPFIGDRLAVKIEEIVHTDRLRRLENAINEPGEKTLRLFLGIYGVGIAQASKWVERGYKTFEDLFEKAKLTENQRIGIDHYDDFNSRIPRAEVEEHGKIVKHVLLEIDPSFEATIMGSYRRGSKDSGDIDIMITKPSGALIDIRTVVCDVLVPRLTSQGFLKCALAATHRNAGSKWHGVSSVPGSNVWRRIDFLLVPWDQLGAALIYFTGNDIFNRSIRLLASKKGMRLNQKGLFKEVMRGKARARVTEGELVESQDEKKIFAALGVPWRPPEHRIC